MSIIFICNIGSRDLLLNGEQIKPAFNEGEKIFNDYKKYENNLSIPIIKPALDYILRYNIKIDKAILCVTDQENSDEKFKQNDTLYFGKIIQMLFQRKYTKEISDTKLLKIKCNPSLYDEMLSFYKEKLIYGEDYEKIYILPVGGTPACNFALIFQGIKIFKDKCNIIYVSEKTKDIIPLNLSQQILEEFEKEIIKTQLKNYDYSSIASILENKSSKEIIYLLAKYSQYRLYFDFRTSQKIIENLLMKTTGRDRQFCEELREKTKVLKEIDRISLSLIEELFLNAKIKYIRQEYVDFLGRIFRFHEVVMRYIVENELQIPTDIGTNEKKENYLDKIKGIEGLEEYLRNEKINNEPLKYYEPNIPTLMAMINFLVKRRGLEKYEKLLITMENLQKLSGLRNYSIIAHGFKGVSKEEIENKYSGDILKDMESVLFDIGIELVTNDFDNINSFIVAKL